jgi:lysine 2,3-aminomutase
MTLKEEIFEETEEPPSFDWHWQLKNRIKNLYELKSNFPTLELTEELLKAELKFPMAITPYYASLIQSCDPSDPIFAMSVPQVEELIEHSYLSNDPLHEESHMPFPFLVHRYPDRVLLISTGTCPVLCRHCTRKRIAGRDNRVINSKQLDQVVNYLQAHPDVHDIIISGGDPLTLSTSSLEKIISKIRSVPTVDIIRIGSRVPVTMPMRITSELTNMLKKYHPIFINTHFNHPNEITKESTHACEQLVNAGIPVGNQTVLLKGINDDPEIIEKLCRGLIKIRVKPYYLFQCDLINGTEHFRTDISCGINIMHYLRGRLSGLAIPNFIVDLPNGGGKIELLPNYILSNNTNNIVFKNDKGETFIYPHSQQYHII